MFLLHLLSLNGIEVSKEQLPGINIKSSEIQPIRFPEPPARLLPFVDALPGLLIHQATKQVIALTFRMTPSEIEITLSGNNDIPPKVTQHIVQIFDLLKSISSLKNVVKIRINSRGSKGTLTPAVQPVTTHANSIALRRLKVASSSWSELVQKFAASASTSRAIETVSMLYSY